ncbi:MFS transporter [Actinacidiphila acidipaludis]|uniref:MFS transporter n=1 Tax=Actinacidiphila acidipaludis TaxID=2873382 RepID=A0ABS7PZF6_9ACTN|nr:MFS transporter [Streptomyces acidipaludis]MBY8876263.1 MFS transporter [Streptomyces acidipaludis]
MSPGGPEPAERAAGRWRALAVLGAGQFLMVLDTSVMNVSISQLVKDFHTEVTAIQAVITLYTLVMAACMITGGKLGDMFGRRRVFAGGLMVYGVGSALTAVAPTLAVLAVGWSVIEGVGAALVLPALAALVAGAYRGRDRAVAYGVIGGLAGAGIAVGPLLGGWLTTYLTWRLVFAGEVVVVLAMLALIRWVPADPPREGPRPRLDVIGALLSAAGLAVAVLGVLQSSSWGWLKPRNPPFEIFGFSPTVFVIALGGVLLGFFQAWERRMAERGGEPLIRLKLFRVPALRSGLAMLLGQNLILLGLFFAIPLYLQIVQGLDAFQTGLRLLPVSATMLLSAMSGPFLGRFAGPRTVVRVALGVLLIAILWLVGTIDPHIDNVSFGFAMAVLGLGMGLLASQLGNVVQSSVGEDERSEVGGLQYTAQNLGSSLGTALIGSILISALVTAFTTQIEHNSAVSQATRQEVGIRLESGVSFVSADQVRAGAQAADLPPAEVDAVVSSYAQAQLNSLKAAILAAAGITLLSFAFTRHLPTEPPAAASGPDPGAASPAGTA